MTKLRKFKLETRLKEIQGIKVDLSPMQIEKDGDFGDQASRLSEQNVTAEISRAKKDEIDRIKLALQADSDQCQDCGDDIPEARLNARPESTLCLRCQAAAEGVEMVEPRRLNKDENRQRNFVNRNRGRR
jgi:DnaK suppressor protein